MLLNYKLNNFKSFGNSQSFTTIPAKYQRLDDHLFKSKNYKALKFAALFGANATGKSNFVKSLKLLRENIILGFINKSFFDYQFKLTDKLSLESNFELEIAINNKVYLYGLSLDFKSGNILREYLYDTTKNTDILIFDRNKNYYKIANTTKDEQIKLEIYINDLLNKEFYLSKIGRLKKSSSKIINIIKSVYNWFIDSFYILDEKYNNLSLLGIFNKDTKNTKKNSIIDILKLFDTGIRKYKYIEIDKNSFFKLLEKYKTSNMPLYIKIMESLNKLKDNFYLELNLENDYYKILFNQESNDYIVKKLKFEHQYHRDTIFNLSEESDGTKRLIRLINLLYKSQFENNTYIIDEIDKSFHPLVTRAFIKNFFKLSKNTKSQLIITTHEVSIMDLDLLRQDEIWIVERNNKGMSILLSLSDYKIKSNKLIEKDYLYGRYGGIPFIRQIMEKDDLNNE